MFRVEDKFGIRMGAEYAFMSTTLDKNVARQYCVGELASTLIEAQMDSHNRGALITPFSYYPAEMEIVFGPLTELEVREQELETGTGDGDSFWVLDHRTSCHKTKFIQKYNLLIV